VDDADGREIHAVIGVKHLDEEVVESSAGGRTTDRDSRYVTSSHSTAFTSGAAHEGGDEEEQVAERCERVL
jgi:hypothetical protein